MIEGSDELVGYRDGKPVYRDGYRREDGVWVCPFTAIPEREVMYMLPSSPWDASRGRRLLHKVQR